MKRFIIILYLTVVWMTVMAQGVGAVTKENDIANADTLVAPHVFKVFTNSRGYADRIALRWMPDEYVPFHFGTKFGYMVTRMHYDEKNDSLEIDTLAACLKPLTIEEFIARYPANDSLAAAAVQTVYGQTMGMNQQRSAPGTAGSIVEEYDQQQMLFGYAAIVADIRFDLAEAMGLGFTDRTAKKGEEYNYIVRMLVPDSLCLTESTAQMGVRMDTYKQPLFSVEMGDSLLNPTTVQLLWPKTLYTAYDVERREMEPGSKVGDDHAAVTPWLRLNQHPYIPFQVEGDDDGENHFTDKDIEPGVYEYRLTGYDSFGDKTKSSAPHRIKLLDTTPPSAPVLKHIEILRTDSTIHARIDFWKDVIEPDLAGCLVFYNNPKVMGDQWIPVRPIGPDGKAMAFIPAGETSCTISCRGLETGDIVVAAIDTLGNVAYSGKQQIRIADVKAPDVPTNFRYTTEIKDNLGLVHLVWTAPEDADIDYYQINSANDTTHLFMPRAYTHGRNDTLYTDTVALGVNQKYIYYKVCAVDFATHQGEFTEVLQVERPSLVVPMVAHIDSTWQDKSALNIIWITGSEAQLAYHKVYRRKANEKNWTVLRVCDADSVKMNGNRICLSDRPAPSRDAYEYAVESFTTSGISSGLSLLYSVRFVGYQNMKCPVRLEGACRENNETILAWDVIGELPNCDDWYYCIYRKGPEDTKFKFLLSAKKDDLTFSDFLLRKGQTAQYYITVMMPGITESQPSNIVTVKSPDAKH